MDKLSIFLFKDEALLNILLYIVVLTILCFLIYKFSKNEKTKEIISVIFLTLAYSIVSLYALGNTIMPTTTWQPSSSLDEIIFVLSDSDFDCVTLFYNEGDNNSNLDTYQNGINGVSLYGSNDLHEWYEIKTFEKGSIYAYNSVYGDFSYKYVRLSCNNKNASISEIAFKKKGKNELISLAIYQDMGDVKYPSSLLIDEQNKVIIYPTYLDQSYFDEVYHVRNANEIANGEYMYASVHPLLGTCFIALGIKIFGDNPLGWRLPGAFFGIMMVPIFYLILKELFKDKKWALFGTLLMDIEFMHLTTSRIATLEPFSVFFILLMYLFMIKYLNAKEYKKKIFNLFICGIFMGLGISTKWTACYSAVGLAILLFTHLFVEYKENKNIKEIIYTLLWCILFFVIIPTIIYFLAYIPCNITRDGYSIKNVINQIVYMYNYHVNLKATHPYQSEWWQWLLDLRPIWYYVGTDENGIYHTISCFTNPIITWFGLLAIIYTIYDLIRHKNKVAYIIVVGYLSALLPWVSFVKRCVFAYHFYPTSCFMLLSIVYLSHRLYSKNKLGKIVTKVFLILSILVFIIYLPAIAGFGTTKTYISILELFSSWNLG